MTTVDESDRVGYLLPFLDGNTYLFGVGSTPRTRIDLAMSYLSASLRRKPRWWQNYKDSATRSQWYKEAGEMWFGSASNHPFQLSDIQINYVLDELDGYDALRQNNTGMQVSCYDRMWESDDLLTPEQRIQLDKAIVWFRSQQDVQTSHLLVDPCRHSVLFSRTLDKSGTKINPPQAIDYATSTSFAFLPSNIGVSSDGSSVRFLSYINGVNPRSTCIYSGLQHLALESIPLFEKTLTDLHRNNTLRQRIPGTYRYAEWDEPDPPEHSDDEDGWQQYEKTMVQWAATRPIVLPDVPNEGFHDDLTKRKYNVSLKGRTIQAIFKIADLVLEPTNPCIHYNDQWHVEGMKNERIVTCLHYFVCLENVDAGKLEFRMAVSPRVKASRDDASAVYRTWGLHDGDECNQYLGFVPIREGLAVIFPNLYQHKQSPVKLVDENMCGRLACVSMLLVDPDAHPIPSTSDVPPQQREWILHELVRSMDKRFPFELIERIINEVDGLLSQDEADEYQSKMTQERERFNKSNNEKFFALPFHLQNLQE